MKQVLPPLLLLVFGCFLGLYFDPRQFPHVVTIGVYAIDSSLVISFVTIFRKPELVRKLKEYTLFQIQLIIVLVVSGIWITDNLAKLMQDELTFLALGIVFQWILVVIVLIKLIAVKN